MLQVNENKRFKMFIKISSELFAEFGYETTSMRKVTQAAGVTPPVLYNLFDSKLSLYRAVVEDQAQQLIQSWSFPENAETPEDLFNETTSTFFRSMQESWLAWRILFTEQPVASEAKAIFQEAQVYATEAVAACIRNLGPLDLPVGMDPNRAIYALAESIKASGHALVAWWHENQDVPIEEVIRLNKAVVWSGVENLIKKDR